MNSFKNSQSLKNKIFEKEGNYDCCRGRVGFIPGFHDFCMLRRRQVGAQKVSLHHLFRQVEVEQKGVGWDETWGETGALSTIHIDLPRTTATCTSGLAFVLPPPENINKK